MPPPHPRPNTVQLSRPAPSNDSSAVHSEEVTNALFIDPILGTPLVLYLAEDVDERHELMQLIQVSPIMLSRPDNNTTILYRSMAGSLRVVILPARIS